MNFIEPNQPLAQPITVTPRAHSVGVYSLRWMAEGTTVVLEIPAALVAMDGSFLTLEAVIQGREKAAYWFKVMVDDGMNVNEVYRGKAFALNPANPLKYSMY